MRAFVALLRKELRSYFGSPLVYLVAAAFLAYTGYYFHSDLIYFLTFGFGVNIMENFWQLLFMDVRLVLIFAVPLLTMRLFAEARPRGPLALPLTSPARRCDRGGEARGVPRRDRRAPGRNARVPRVGLSSPPLPAAAARGGLRRAPPARRGLRRLRGLRFVAHRQSGARGLPHVDAPAAALAALVERGCGRPLDAAALAGNLALQPLPALRRGHRRPARRLLLRVRHGALRVGDAARARGAAVAGRAMTAAGQ